MFFQRMWRSRSASSVNAATPLVIGDQIFISAAYETGAALVRVQGSELKELWSSDEVLSNHYATSVHDNGILYGFHGRQEYNPSFRAVDCDTGKVKWSVDRFHAGTVTLAGDKLLILRETGELMLATASPRRSSRSPRRRFCRRRFAPRRRSRTDSSTCATPTPRTTTASISPSICSVPERSCEKSTSSRTSTRAPSTTG